MADSSKSVACDLYPIKNGWKILQGGVRIGLASSLGTALTKIARLSTNTGALYRILIFKEDGSFDVETGSFSQKSTQVPEANELAYQEECGTVGVSSQEKIALLAYSYWEKRGRQGGAPEEDWYRAEQEILKQI